MIDTKPADLFEQALVRLEEIVKKLESGGATLDESVLLFREGKELARYCEVLLKDAEAAVAMLNTQSEQHMLEPDR